MDDNSKSMPEYLKQIIRYKINIWLYEPSNSAKYLMEGNTIVYLSDNRGYREIIQSKSIMNKSQK